MNITAHTARTIPLEKFARDHAPKDAALCARCRRFGEPRCRACKPSGLESCTGCSTTVSLLPRGDIPQAWVETIVHMGSHTGPRQILYYCKPCASDPTIVIPEEGAIIARVRDEGEITLPGIF